MELIQRIVVEDEKYPLQYISIYKSRGKKVVVTTTIPHSPSEQALINLAKGIKKIMDKQMLAEFKIDEEQEGNLKD
jgi:F0F1-type ATP synthase delta subunit